MLSFITAAQLRMSKTLITFYRCVLIFNETTWVWFMALSWKAVLSQVWSQFSWLLRKIRYTHSSVLLDIRNMMQAQTRLFTCDDCVRLNGCSGVLLTQGKQDHIPTCPESLPQCDIRYKRNELNAYTFWSSLIRGCENIALNILNYSSIQRWVVSFMPWLSLYRLERKLRGSRFGLVIWRREKSLTSARNHPLIPPLSSS